MSVIRWGAAAVAVLALGGCVAALPPGPSVTVMPGPGKSFEAFRADDGTCRQFAAQQAGIAPADAANQSLVGSAAVGTVLGAATGAAIGAGSGLALGTASGVDAAQYAGASTQQRYDIGYVQCMSAKGESVPQMPAPQTAYAAPPYPYPYAAYPYYAPYPYYYPGYDPGWYGPRFGFGFGFHDRDRDRFHH